MDGEDRPGPRADDDRSARLHHRRSPGRGGNGAGRARDDRRRRGARRCGWGSRRWNGCRAASTRRGSAPCCGRHAPHRRSLARDGRDDAWATELLGSTSPSEGWPSSTDRVRAGRDGLIGHVVLVHEACFHAMTGDFARARERLRESEALAERFGSPLWRRRSWSSAPTSKRWRAIRRRPSDRSARNTSSIADGRRGARVDLRSVSRGRALPSGPFDEAEELATIARTIGADDDLHAGERRSAQALARSARGELTHRLAREAVDLYAGHSPWFHGDTLMVLAEVARAAGLPEEAADAARAALAAYERKGHEPGAASANASTKSRRIRSDGCDERESWSPAPPASRSSVVEAARPLDARRSLFDLLIGREPLPGHLEPDRELRLSGADPTEERPVDPRDLVRVLDELGLHRIRSPRCTTSTSAPSRRLAFQVDDVRIGVPVNTW